MTRRVAGGPGEFRRAPEPGAASAWADSRACSPGLEAGVAGLRRPGSGAWSCAAQPCESAAAHEGRACSKQDPSGRWDCGAVVRSLAGERGRKA